MINKDWMQLGNRHRVKKWEEALGKKTKQLRLLQLAIDVRLQTFKLYPQTWQMEMCASHFLGVSRFSGEFTFLSVLAERLGGRSWLVDQLAPAENISHGLKWYFPQSLFSWTASKMTWIDYTNASIQWAPALCSRCHKGLLLPISSIHWVEAGNTPWTGHAYTNFTLTLTPGGTWIDRACF